MGIISFAPGLMDGSRTGLRFFPFPHVDVDSNTFEEFLEPEGYVDHVHLFAIDRIFNLKIALVDWAKETAMKVNTYLIVTRYLKLRTSDRRPYVTLACERRGANKSRTKSRVDDKEEEDPIKRQGPYGTKKCGSPFKLKGEQMATSKKCQLFVHDGRHNHTEKDIDSEKRDLAFLLDQISTCPISKVTEMCRLAKGVLNPVLPEDPSMTLTSAPEVTATKGQHKMNSTKRTSRTGSMCPLLIERYKSQAILVSGHTKDNILKKPYIKITY
ncbi:hypothetical protein M9H77_26096 [Catharanthus roseus]|uniref:Uncharacterized protein n=1 Tax=Catharanthus roseus TaxID=4058 RepID=A0ACC0ABD0_CATRO|nr:hypothetical protein M9H77_26096 [Catharanthus roseus]